MKHILSILVSLTVISSVSFAQDGGGRGRRDRDRQEERDRNPDRGNPDRGPGRGPGRDRDRNPPGRGPDRRPQYRDYAGAIGPGDYCPDCAFENRSDTPRSRRGNERYLVNSDRHSIDARCRELGWDYGQALEWFSYQEWCRYGNARTRTWDSYNYQWVFGRCTDGNVKMARCFRR